MFQEVLPSFFAMFGALLFAGLPKVGARDHALGLQSLCHLDGMAWVLEWGVRHLEIQCK